MKTYNLWINSYPYFKENEIKTTYKTQYYTLRISEHDLYLECFSNKVEMALFSVSKFLLNFNSNINFIFYVKSKNSVSHVKGYYSNSETKFYTEKIEEINEKLSEVNFNLDISDIDQLHKKELLQLVNYTDENISIFAAENGNKYASLIFNRMSFDEIKHILNVALIKY